MNGGEASALLRAKLEESLRQTQRRIFGVIAVGDALEIERALRDHTQVVWIEVQADSLETMLAMAREIEGLRRDVAALREAVKQ